MKYNNDNYMVGIYRIDNQYILYLEEENDGFKCVWYNNEPFSFIFEYHLSWEELNESPIRGVLACARNLAIKNHGINGNIVKSISIDEWNDFYIKKNN